jgi:hypothetical protein
MADAEDSVLCDNCGKSFPEKQYTHKVFNQVQYLTCPGCKCDFNRTVLIKKGKRDEKKNRANGKNEK